MLTRLLCLLIIMIVPLKPQQQTTIEELIESETAFVGRDVVVIGTIQENIGSGQYILKSDAGAVIMILSNAAPTVLNTRLKVSGQVAVNPLTGQVQIIEQDRQVINSPDESYPELDSPDITETDGKPSGRIIFIIILITFFIGISVGVYFITNQKQLEIKLLSLSTNKELTLKGKSHLIGKGTGSGLKINDPVVSRKHARIAFNSDSKSWHLTDLGSKNGTYVNDSKIRQVKLSPGDIITICGYKYKVL
ncbi:MAG: hypothetical protein AMXMBFR48_19510 [Ignavibacteriales bacterium]